MEFWFRRKYLLAPTDPRSLDASFEAILLDYYTWQALERPDDIEDEDDDFDVEEVTRRMENPDDWDEWES